MISIWGLSTQSHSWTRTGVLSRRQMIRQYELGILISLSSLNILLSLTCIQCLQSPSILAVSSPPLLCCKVELIVVKYIEKWFATQSLDNQILVYSAENFRQNRKKRYAGHSIAGFACQVNFSPDGRFISSGDGEGNVVFWDWKTGRIKSRLRAHSKVVIAHEWLPHETVRANRFCSVTSLISQPSLVKGSHCIMGWINKVMGE